VDEIAAIKEDVQQGRVMAALTIVAVVIAMASLSPSFALCEEEQQREASTHCVCKQTKGSSTTTSHGVHTFLPLGFQGFGF
jgi:hypothetical protein